MKRQPSLDGVWKPAVNRVAMRWLAWLGVAVVGLLGSCALGPQVGTGAAKARKDREFTEFFRRTNGWTAGDGAISVPLSNGRVLWLFGDSHVDDIDPKTGTMPCLFQARNAALLQETNGTEQVITLVGKGPGFRPWFKNSKSDDQWFWPLCGFEAGKAIYVYFVALEKTG